MRISRAPARPCTATIELIDPQTLRPGRGDPDIAQYLRPEPLIESDAPEIVAEAEEAVAACHGRARDAPSG